jgi:putative membrane protein
VRRLLAAATLAIALCACAGGGPPPPTPQRAARGAPPVVIRPLFAADYVAAASSADLFAIRSGELALERARDSRLRDVARMMIADHQGTSAQLSMAGRRLNLVPPAVMRPDHQAQYEALVADADFDGAYLRQQLQLHEAALRLHSDFAARGESPTLRPVAANAVSIIRRHLDQLRALR